MTTTATTTTASATAIKALAGHDREIRLFAVWCARGLRAHTRSMRCRLGIVVAEAFAHDECTADDVSAIKMAAYAAYDEAAHAAIHTANAAHAAHAVATIIGYADDPYAAAVVAAGDAARIGGETARSAQFTELGRVRACIDSGVDPYPRTLGARLRARLVLWAVRAQGAASRLLGR